MKVTFNILIWASQLTCLSYLPLDLVSASLGLAGSHSWILYLLGHLSLSNWQCRSLIWLWLQIRLQQLIPSNVRPCLFIHLGPTHIICEESSFRPASCVWSPPGLTTDNYKALPGWPHKGKLPSAHQTWHPASTLQLSGGGCGQGRELPSPLSWDAGLRS